MKYDYNWRKILIQWKRKSTNNEIDKISFWPKEWKAFIEQSPFVTSVITVITVRSEFSKIWPAASGILRWRQSAFSSPRLPCNSHSFHLPLMLFTCTGWMIDSLWYDVFCLPQPEIRCTIETERVIIFRVFLYSIFLSIRNYVQSSWMLLWKFHVWSWNRL